MSTVHKAFQVIETVSETGRAGINEISSKTGFPPSTVHRILTSLLEMGYVLQEPATKSYSLSLRFFELGSRVQEKFNVTPYARPYLLALHEETKESTNLVVLDNDAAVYLDHVNSDYGLQLFTKLGARVPLYSTGVGKAFLSRFTAEQYAEYIKRTSLVPKTHNTFVGSDDLLVELEKIRRTGYAIDNEENEYGSRCVATLIYYHNENNAAALSVSGPAVRITPERYEEIANKVKTNAEKIAKRLGYSNQEINQMLSG